MLNAALQQVLAFRQQHEASFPWPGPLWSALYVHEELSELMRVVQQYLAPAHQRAAPRHATAEQLQFEAGQLLFMVFTLLYELGITDLDQALQSALMALHERLEAR